MADNDIKSELELGNKSDLETLKFTEPCMIGLFRDQDLSFTLRDAGVLISKKSKPSWHRAHDKFVPGDEFPPHLQHDRHLDQAMVAG